MDTQRKLGSLKIYLGIIGFAIPVFSIIVGDILAAGRTPDFVFTVKIALMAALFSLVAIPTFLSGLHNFKAGLNRSYVLLCIGIGIFGLAQFQIPAVNLTGWWIWLDSGLAGLVYLISVIPMLLGMRMFAKLLNIKTRWSSIWLCVVAFAIINLALWFAPRAHQTGSDIQFHVFIGVVVWSALVMLFCGMLALNIRKVIAPAYKKSLWWLACTFFVLMFGGLHFIGVYHLLDNGDWYFDYSINILPFVIGGLLFIKAGYEFNAVNQVLSEGENDNQPAEGKQQPSGLEVITHVASLASNPSDVDAILDDMRVATARIEADKTPETTDETKLYEVYKRLVVYLTKQDPLRQYTDESIRDNLTATFGKGIDFLDRQKG
jgi:hypothetical protein